MITIFFYKKTIMCEEDKEVNHQFAQNFSNEDGIACPTPPEVDVLVPIEIVEFVHTEDPNLNN